MEQPRISNLIVNSYGIGELTFTLMMNIAIAYYAYFLTDVALISAATMGTMLLIARVADAIFVPVSGAVIQRLHPKWGQFRTWMFISPPIAGLFFVIMFTDLDVSTSMKAVYLCASYIIAHAAINFTSTAHLGFLQVLGKTSFDRVRLSGRKAQFGAAGAIVFAVAVIPLFDVLGGGDVGKSFTYIVAIFASTQILGYWWIFKISKPWGNPYQENAKRSPDIASLTVKELLAQVFKNSQLMILMVADTVKFTAFFILMAMATYYFKYVVGNMGLMSVFMLSIFVAAFLGTIVVPHIANQFGKKLTYILVTLVAGISFILLGLLAGKSYIYYIVLLSLANAGLASTNSILPAMFADTAEFGFFKSGKDGSAFIMSLVAIPIKIGIAICGAILGFGLALIGYHPNVVVTDSLISGMIGLNAFVPAICCFLAIGVTMFYRLNEMNVSQFIQVNEQRRNAA